MSDKCKVGDCQRGDSSLIRPHFTEGLLLQDDDLTAGVTYTRALSRLMFRTLFGCGVLCGLRVSKPRKECGALKIDVDKGVALSCLGDPIELLKAQTISIDPCKVDVGKELWIVLRGTEKCCAPRTAMCSDDENTPSTCTRERDGFELCAVASRPACACGCAKLTPPPAPAPQQPAAATPPPAAAAPPVPPGPCGASEPSAESPPAANTPCHCNQRTGTNACYEKYYQGECPCGCCDCEWIILAVVNQIGDTDDWKIDHSVRRFVRPVLMRDWVVEQERLNLGA